MEINLKCFVEDALPKEYVIEKIVDIGVDSGCIMIVDPCYVLPDKRECSNDPGLDYMEFLESTVIPDEGPGRKLTLEGHECGAVISLGGDGDHPLYGIFHVKGEVKELVGVLNVSAWNS